LKQLEILNEKIKKRRSKKRFGNTLGLKKTKKKTKIYGGDENIAFYPIIRCAGKIWPENTEEE